MLKTKRVKRVKTRRNKRKTFRRRRALTKIGGKPSSSYVREREEQRNLYHKQYEHEQKIKEWWKNELKLSHEPSPDDPSDYPISEEELEEELNNDWKTKKEYIIEQYKKAQSKERSNVRDIASKW